MNGDAAPARTINLSLVSHTNAGKTTLVRTLLKQDVGEVRDAAHVTTMATGYPLLQAGNDTLMLWDTPGFGDTARLVKRLRLSSNPIGWLLTQAWDRLKDRPLWSSQQAVRNARDEADIILYLVNGSEDPAGAAYVGLEMEVLDWVAKPIILLVNQTGPPTAENWAEEERWRSALSGSHQVQSALTLDAFARCWVQERNLLDAISPLLEPGKQAAAGHLTEVWTERNLRRFRDAMSLLASHLRAAVQDRESIGDAKWHDRVRTLVLSPGGGHSVPGERAMGKLAERLQADLQRNTDELITIHGLAGHARNEVLRRVEQDFTESAPARPGIAAVLGGLASGAAGGIAADLATGGLTLGGGLIIGSILGAVGAGSAAKTYNLAKGEETTSVRWSEPFFAGLFRSALLRYLAVAHFGRGRGDWEEGESPAHWNAEVAQETDRLSSQLKATWSRARDAIPEELQSDIQKLLTSAAEHILIRLYPTAAQVFSSGNHDESSMPVT